MTRKKNFRPSNQQRTQPGSDNTVVGRAPEHVRQQWNRKKTRYSAGSLVRGYVVAVYASDDSSPARSPARLGIRDKATTYLCDVQLVESTYSGILPRVPIVTGAFGITDRILWTPRPATKDVKKGNAISLETTSTTTASPIHDSDGDLVIVAFLDNDYNKPIIVGALQHPQTLVPVSSSDDMPKFEATIRGNRIAIDGDGKVVIDASAQTDGSLNSDGSENAASDPTIEIKTADVTITVNNAGVNIEASGTDVAVQAANVEVSLDTGGKTTIGGNSGAGIAEELVKSGAWDDMFGPTGAFWLEAFPILAAAGGMFGLATVNLGTLMGLFGLGTSTTGATVTTDSTESE